MMTITATPSWVNLTEMIDQDTLDEIKALVAELETLQGTVRETFIRVFRLSASLTLKMPNVTDLSGLSVSVADAICELLDEFTGQQRLTELGYTIINDVAAAIEDHMSSDVPWLADERAAVEREYAALGRKPYWLHDDDASGEHDEDG